ncbi:trypsin-like peptidase domain-containing protein [Streptomyces griseorubiginosus]|uniref:Glutamyl endopeptidase n=1 Tax=Streptomyces griseorubiginosus TaxID=67304 RepID=A0AAI8PPM6_9ACTN|nr:trypsin-like peptidase domain-containing protein [Streptomyces griseorubiginosus]AYC40251.1 Glutamyl endopeptidase [Streptomyces griseorubiginosus]
MKRTPRTALYAVVVLLAVTASSEAIADDGTGPFGVTEVAPAGSQIAMVGALFDGRQHVCTASVVRSPHKDLVVTAAHCLDDSDDLVFEPGYRDGRAPYGKWKVEKRYLPEGWSKGQDENSDLAFATVDGKVQDRVGANRFTTGTATGATAVTVTGYPSSRDVPISCTNKPTAHSRTQQRIDCPEFTGGTSGSPWVNGDRQVVGVLGGHEEGGLTPDVSYSVVLGAEAAELYREAVC